MNQDELHKKVLYPIVRVKTQEAGGSGSVIYSEPSKKNPEEYQSFILTNWHVIQSAIKYAKEWDSVLKRKRDKDFLSQVDVEVFDYVYLSTVNSSNSFKADIVAYDEPHDLAILKLITPKQLPYVAQLVSREGIKKLRLFTPVRGCGCSLLHDPFSTLGEITGLREIIDNKEYLMTSQNSIFGNSGGAIFLADTGEQIGVTARITGINLGFGGADIMTWMGFCVAPQRIYEFIDEQEFQFIYNPKESFEAGMERREKKRKEQMMQSLRRSTQGGDSEESE